MLACRSSLKPPETQWGTHLTPDWEGLTTDRSHAGRCGTLVRHTPHAHFLGEKVKAIGQPGTGAQAEVEVDGGGGWYGKKTALKGPEEKGWKRGSMLGNQWCRYLERQAEGNKLSSVARTGRVLLAGTSR